MDGRESGRTERRKSIERGEEGGGRGGMEVDSIGQRGEREKMNLNER